jgi:hypothetical protein
VLRARLRSLWVLLTDPAEWSARHYARKNRMDFAALRPRAWRTDVGLDRDGVRAPSCADAVTTITSTEHQGKT